jgi:riboflavin kinase
MAGTVRSLSVGHDELATLKLLALDGVLDGEVKASCADLADRLDASSQTASRRLQRLDDGGLIERELVSDGQWISITDDGVGALQREYEDYRRIFEGPSNVELVGRVTSGMGEGRHYISLPGYMAQFEERLGYAPFEGTLNLELTDESVRKRSAMDALEPVPIDGWEDDERTYGPAVCYAARVERVAPEGQRNGGGAAADGESYEPAHVIAPERTHHDEDQLEVIAPEKLRDVLDLADGDHLTVTVTTQGGSE